LAAIAGAQEPPSITITAPAEGEVLPGPDLTVQVAVSGFTFRLPCEATGSCDESAREPNAGYIEYFVDVPPAFDQPTPLGEDNIIHSGRLSETFTGVAPGEHSVYVCLAYSEHTCIGPSLVDSVRVTVGQPPPTPEATPTTEPPPPTPEPPPPTEPPATPLPTEEPVLDGLTEQTPSPTAAVTASPSPTPRATPPAPSTPLPGLAPSTFADTGNARSVDWALALACASVVALVAVGWLTLMGVRRPSGKR
jgi:hypothetical protein